MSHFNCVVFGENVDEQLTPFEDGSGVFELTALSDIASKLFKTDASSFSDRDLIKLLRQLTGEQTPVAIVHPEQISEGPSSEFYKDIVRAGIDFVIAFDDKGKAHAVHRRSYANCKWDWYQVGGRWAAYWLPKPNLDLKPYLQSDQAGNRGWMMREPDYKPEHEYGRDFILKGDIDIEKMIDIASAPMMEAHLVLGKFRKDHKTYDQVARALFPDQSVELSLPDRIKINDQYSSQDSVKENYRLKYFFSHDDLDILMTYSEKKYAQYCRDVGIAPFSYIHEGKWYERGTMGWFGQSHGDLSRDQWGRQFRKVFDSMPDDELVTMVDCHI